MIYFNENFRPSAGVIIYTTEGVILVKEKEKNFSYSHQGFQKVTKTFFKLPGGKSKSWEKEERETALREVLEETGINLIYMRDQMSLEDVIIRHGFRHSIFLINLPFLPILKIDNEIGDIKIVSPEDWRKMREENEILKWHASVVEKVLPEFSGYIEPVYA
ncbi:MAG: NUDIX hydrolase [Candidatus Paceibacterota bacterium]